VLVIKIDHISRQSLIEAAEAIFLLHALTN